MFASLRERLIAVTSVGSVSILFSTGHPWVLGQRLKNNTKKDRCPRLKSARAQQGKTQPKLAVPALSQTHQVHCMEEFLVDLRLFWSVLLPD